METCYFIVKKKKKEKEKVIFYCLGTKANTLVVES